MPPLKSILHLIVFLLAFAPAFASGANFVVNSTADAIDSNPGDGICASAADVCTLRASVMEANALPGADTITLPAGHFLFTLGTPNEDAAASGDLDIMDSVTITGAGAEQTIINADGLDRVFHVDIAGSGLAVTISKLTIRNGNALGSSVDGGGILNNGATLLLSEVDVIDNFGDDGGGIWNQNGSSLTIEDSRISGNVGDADAGGVGSTGSGSTLTIRRTIISHNMCFSSRGGGVTSEVTSGSINTIEDSKIIANFANQHGGGVYLTNGTFNIIRTEVSGNFADTGGGGGVYGAPDGVLNISDSTISGNRANDFGGGIRSQAPGSSISNTTIHGNHVRSDGGGVSAGGSPTSLQNCTITGNQALNDGGGIFVEGTNALNITNCTIGFNLADADFASGGVGGGIDNSNSGTLNLRNTIIAHNKRRSVDENCGAGTLLTSGGNNIDSDGTCPLGATGDVDADPLFLPLADNGGPVLTHALSFLSPAIDNGNNATCPSADARGFLRPADGDGNGSQVCDIGAYEFGVDCNENNVSDATDIAIGTSEDCDGNGVPDECQNDSDSDGIIDSCENPTADLNSLTVATQMAVKKIKFRKKSAIKAGRDAIAAADEVIAFIAANGSAINLLAGSTIENITEAAKQGKKQIKAVRKQALFGTNAQYIAARKKALNTFKKKIQEKLLP